ncbi:AIG2-like (avirulence induced gene) family protein [Actinidia rufa]|uniref:Gamma-glutamylcyclotransferase family protein n=1 Tax=Actinidia rufa TaxID=165716 RepID=A0A7J0GX78_9ERIC|nr:AIG2-like (avirulence induced gene) family protein [Actinidia rufa]
MVLRSFYNFSPTRREDGDEREKRRYETHTNPNLLLRHSEARLRQPRPHARPNLLKRRCLPRRLPYRFRAPSGLRAPRRPLPPQPPRVWPPPHPRRALRRLSPRGLARIDELEGITLGHYERLPIQLLSASGVDGDCCGGGEVVEAEAYYAHRSFAEEMWQRKGKVGFGEYTETGEYVRRNARPKERSFLEEIRLFVSSSPSSSSS